MKYIHKVYTINIQYMYEVVGNLWYNKFHRNQKPVFAVEFAGEV